MNLACTILLNHCAVEDGAIALVAIKAILGIFFVEAHHDAIARNFRDDRCGRDCGDFFVSLDDGLIAYRRGQ